MKDLEELTTHCIRCGFCLESCPTFSTTGMEMESPRGRIYLVRSAAEGKLRWQEDVRPHLENCLGCLACETACPSGVEYGAILEMAREKLEQERPGKIRQRLLRSLTRPGSLRLQLALSKLVPGRRVPAMLSKMLSGEAAQADKPLVQVRSNCPPLDESELPPLRGEVLLLEGCAMRVLFPRVHEATRRLLRRVGYSVREVSQGCCGALHAHNGLLQEAKAMSATLADQLPADLPLVVNSAGCGSWLKSNGDFEGRVVDVTEFLAAQGLVEQLRASQGVEAAATYHDACHLAHGQGVRSQPRQLLEAVPNLQMMELPESDLCCGSAGIYNLVRPTMARALLDRKWANVKLTGADLVVLGNPGCHAWIEQAARESGCQTRVLHTAELLEASFSGLP